MLQNIRKNGFIYIFILLYFLVGILVMQLVNTDNEAVNSNISIVPQIWLNTWAVLVVVLTIASNVIMFRYMYQLSNYQKSTKKKTNIQQLTVLYNLLSIVLTTALFLMLVGLLYLLGLTSYIYYFLNSYLFPILNDSVSKFISFIATILIPGLITNFVYDFLKEKTKKFWDIEN